MTSANREAADDTTTHRRAPVSPWPAIRNVGLAIACWWLCGALSVLAFNAPVMAERMSQTYVSFGADLPWLTRFVIWARYGWWVLPAIALAIAFFASTDNRKLPERQKKIAVAFLALTIISFALVVLALVAFYLPVFALRHVA